MKLYGFPPSPNTRKVLATAIALGLPLDLELVNLAAGAQRKPEYLALNPNGRTPTLVDGDFVLWESNAIMQYLASVRPGPLWPNDARARADISRWQCWQLAHWNEGTAKLIFQRVLKKILALGDPDPAEVENGEKAFHRDAGVLEGWLATRRFLVGDAPTLADFAVAAPLEFTAAAAFPLEGYRNVRAWYARIDALPAWQESRPRM
jgi:glutathione S-transferase